MLRVVVKELKELLRLLVVLPLRGARRASSAACRFDGRMKTSKALRGVWSRRRGVCPSATYAPIVISEWHVLFLLTRCFIGFNKLQKAFQTYSTNSGPKPMAVEPRCMEQLMEPSFSGVCYLLIYIDYEKPHSELEGEVFQRQPFTGQEKHQKIVGL